MKQCIDSPYFDKVRKLSKIVDAPRKVDLPFENQNLSLKEIRYEFSKIVNDY